MHELGFSVVTKKKGAFVDGHEQEDIAEIPMKNGVPGVPKQGQCPNSRDALIMPALK